MTFRSVLLLSGKTATGLEVPAEVVEALGTGKRPAVVVTLNGSTYRSTIAPYSGAYILPVSAEIRERAGVVAGDTLEVTVERDTEPRAAEVPEDLAASLAAHEGAKARFEALSNSNQRRLVLSVESAKPKSPGPGA